MFKPSSASEPGGPGDPRAANRIAGLAVLGFALALWLWLIPWQVDAADYGWLRPRTLPMICAVGLGIGGLGLALFPAGRVELAPVRSLRVAGLLVLAGITVWAIGRWGFLRAAPVFALVLVAVLRERRWPWILASVALIPAFIWSAAQFLGRPLP